MSRQPKMMRLEVYDQLKQQMFTGALKTGQFVSQRELTELLGATLNPVREAIRKLEAEGLITVYAQRGIQIAEGGPKAINDAYDFRALIERDAVRRFALTAQPEVVADFVRRVQESLGKLEQFGDDKAVRLAVLDDDYNFHKSLVDYQGNAIISQHYSVNAARLRLFRVNIGEPLQRLDVAAREHLEIVDACAAGAADRAVELLAQHIEISREHTLGVRPIHTRAVSQFTHTGNQAASKP